MTNAVTITPVRARSYTIVVGTPLIIDMMAHSFPTTVYAIPGGGGSLAVESTGTPSARSDPGSANWIAWPSGTVTAITSDTLKSPVLALRITATTANGIVEIVS